MALVRLTFDGTHIATRLTPVDLHVHEAIATLINSTNWPADLLAASYPMLNNIKPLRDSSKLSDYLGCTQRKGDMLPHHIDLRPTIKGGGRRPRAERGGKEEVSSDDEGSHPRQDTNADEPDAAQSAAEWDMVRHAERISAASAAEREWRGAGYIAHCGCSSGCKDCVKSGSNDPPPNKHATSDTCINGNNGAGSGRCRSHSEVAEHDKHESRTSAHTGPDYDTKRTPAPSPI